MREKSAIFVGHIIVCNLEALLMSQDITYIIDLPASSWKKKS